MYLIVDGESSSEDVVRVRGDCLSHAIESCGSRTVQRTIAGAALADCAGVRGNLRKEIRSGHSSQRTGLIQSGARGHQGLVSLQQLLLVAVERRIVKDLPPRALGN